MAGSPLWLGLARAERRAGRPAAAGMTATGTPVRASVGNEAMGGVPPDPARFARPPDPGLGRRVSVEGERNVDAPMERVWALLRHYRVARPRLLSEPFSDYRVQERGDGAGTVIAYRLRVGRHQREHVIAVQEPVPGRVLRDRDRASALVSTWTLTPGGEGERTVVRLAVAPRDPRISGWLARARARRALRRLCDQPLEHVDAELGGERSPGPG
jgi:hypothetical protein